MERLVQCLDDLEDLFYAAALKAERIRQLVRFSLFIAASAILQVFGIYIALRIPPLAVALASLLMVGMLFRAVVGFSSDAYAS